MTSSNNSLTKLINQISRSFQKSSTLFVFAIFLLGMAVSLAGFSNFYSKESASANNNFSCPGNSTLVGDKCVAQNKTYSCVNGGQLQGTECVATIVNPINNLSCGQILSGSSSSRDNLCQIYGVVENGAWVMPGAQKLPDQACEGAPWHNNIQKGFGVKTGNGYIVCAVIGQGGGRVSSMYFFPKQVRGGLTQPAQLGGCPAGWVDNGGANCIQNASVGTYTIDQNSLGNITCNPNPVFQGELSNCTAPLSGSPTGQYVLPANGIMIKVWDSVPDYSDGARVWNTINNNSDKCTISGSTLICNNLNTTGISTGQKPLSFLSDLNFWLHNKGTLTIVPRPIPAQTSEVVVSNNSSQGNTNQQNSSTNSTPTQTSTTSNSASSSISSNTSSDSSSSASDSSNNSSQSSIGDGNSTPLVPSDFTNTNNNNGNSSASNSNGPIVIVCNNGNPVMVNSKTTCTFELPNGKTLPPDLQLGIGNADPSGSCSATGKQVTCINVPTGSQTGEQKVFAKIGDSQKVETTAKVMVQADNATGLLDTTIRSGGIVVASILLTIAGLGLLAFLYFKNQKRNSLDIME